MGEFEEAVREEMNRHRGKTLGAIEAIGLPERQEKALKQLIKSMSYDSEARLIEIGEDLI